MVITLDFELETALKEEADRQGVTLEALVVETLRTRFVAPPSLPEPQDDWERRLRDAAKNCGVSIPNWALSSDGLYE